MKTVFMVKVADLHISPNYVQIYALENKQRELLKESIQSTDGLLEPIVITLDNMIVHGTQRFLAYKELEREEIPARYIDKADELDPTLQLINFNRHRDKSMFERWSEINYLKKLYQKKQGERTDLKDGVSEYDKFPTRKKIALHCNISEGNVYKIEKIAEQKIELLNFISSGELSLNEAYKRVTQKTKENNRPALEQNSEEVGEIFRHVCPHCNSKF
jgi:hypothetical protein